MIQFKKIVSGALMVSTSLALTGLGFVNTTFAAQLTNASATLSNSTQGAASVQYVIAFKVASTANIGSLKLQWSTTATNTTKPTNFDASGVTAAAAVQINTLGVFDTEWGNPASANGGEEIDLTTAANGGPKSYTSGQTLFVTLSNLQNNNLTSNCDGTADSTDSCWIQIKTYNDTNWTTLDDQTAINYTVISPISVSATVDPILNFVILGVSSGAISTNDTDVVTGTQTTSTPTALSFGDIVAGSGSNAKLAQQQLDVTTNANGGYIVYNNFTGSNLMTGTAQPANNIDPFTETSATWSVPKSWTSPTGTANSVNSGELGMRTTDTATANTSQFAGSGLYGPPTLTPNTNAVMAQNTPDNGARNVFVTYKLEVNAYQPADLYTGSTLYTVVATY